MRYNNLINSFPDTEVSPLIKLWVLRILVTLNGHKEFIENRGFDDDTIAELIGLEHIIKAKKFKPKKVLVELQTLLLSFEKEAKSIQHPKSLTENINKLSSLVGLNKTDHSILQFTVLLKNEPLLSSSCNYLGDHLSLGKVYIVLSVLLNLPESEIRRSLSAKGALVSSGLLRIYNHRYGSHLSEKLNLLSDEFSEIIYSNSVDPMDLLKSSISKSKIPELRLNDFDHLKKELDVLKPYLKQAISSNRKGVNIFIYGDPGTGKTELAKVLIHALGYNLFEVSSEDEYGEPISGIQRLRAFRMAQNILSNQKSILLFDEVEDIFSDGGFFSNSTAQTHKAWINRTLEENPIPCLWITNSSNIDNAFIRRYDMVLELPVPPKKQRQKIITQNCSSFLNEPTISRIAESERLSPAVVSRSASVIKSIQSDLTESQVSDSFELIVNHTLETQGHKPIKKNDPNRLPRNYDPRCINADTNIDDLADGLKQSKSGRLCIYGPPGTGKTAYGRWLAEQLEMPLLVKRGSDIHSKWVGGTEKNIANAFKEAETEGALLLIDEVEGFLQDRRNAKASWETTAVNEMLTQMESFSGVFIASTNLIDTLDQAALRRFDLKMKFDFLKTEQALKLLKSYCQDLSLSVPTNKDQQALKQLPNLTPGDFAAITRQHRFRPFTTASALVSALEYEAGLKEGMQTSKIGFH